MKNVTFLAISLALAFGFLAAAQAQSLKPGLWRSTTTMVVSGQAATMPPVEACLTAEDAKDMRAFAEKKLRQNKGNGGEVCKITEWKQSVNTISYTASCTGGAISAIKGTGSFSATEHNMKSQLTGKHADLGIAYTLDARTSSKRIGACK